jgi:hypothetical protein
MQNEPTAKTLPTALDAKGWAGKCAHSARTEMRSMRAARGRSAAARFAVPMLERLWSVAA